MQAFTLHSWENPSRNIKAVQNLEKPCDKYTGSSFEAMVGWQAVIDDRSARLLEQLASCDIVGMSTYTDNEIRAARPDYENGHPGAQGQLGFCGNESERAEYKKDPNFLLGYLYYHREKIMKLFHATGSDCDDDN